MTHNSTSAGQKKFLFYILFAFIYLIVAAITFYFLSKSGIDLYLAILGGLLWPLILLVTLLTIGNT